MIFNFSITSKCVGYIPLLISQRFKVRILPKEHYDEDETPYMSMKRKPKRSAFLDFLSIVHQKNLLSVFWNWRKLKVVEEMHVDQRFIPERHRILGPDLATAHFITVRGGKVKFLGKGNWMTKDDVESGKIPSCYMPGLWLEEVDASDMNLCYEGFDNLCNLTKLKKLYLRNCPNVDDWCLSRSHLFASTLEYLDISGCHLVTERGICVLHSLKKLKTLVLNNTPNIQNKELVCLLLQEIIPECNIIGVDYNNPVLLKRIESFIP